VPVAVLVVYYLVIFQYLQLEVYMLLLLVQAAQVQTALVGEMAVIV
jgi:hypothetical protein